MPQYPETGGGFCGKKRRFAGAQGIEAEFRGLAGGKPAELERIARFPAQSAGNAPGLLSLFQKTEVFEQLCGKLPVPVIKPFIFLYFYL
jgi:hypothetical protein